MVSLILAVLLGLEKNLISTPERVSDMSQNSILMNKADLFLDWLKIRQLSSQNIDKFYLICSGEGDIRDNKKKLISGFKTDANNLATYIKDKLKGDSVLKQIKIIEEDNSQEAIEHVLLVFWKLIQISKDLPSDEEHEVELNVFTSHCNYKEMLIIFTIYYDFIKEDDKYLRNIRIPLLEEELADIKKISDYDLLKNRIISSKAVGYYKTDSGFKITPKAFETVKGSEILMFPQFFGFYDNKLNCPAFLYSNIINGRKEIETQITKRPKDYFLDHGININGKEKEDLKIFIKTLVEKPLPLFRVLI